MRNKKLMWLTGVASFLLAGFFQNFVVFGGELFQLISAAILGQICVIMFAVQYWYIYIKK